MATTLTGPIPRGRPPAPGTAQGGTLGPDPDARIRVAAAKELLDRGHGKPPDSG
jgi:hypothetical protein